MSQSVDTQSTSDPSIPARRWRRQVDKQFAGGSGLPRLASIANKLQKPKTSFQVQKADIFYVGEIVGCEGFGGKPITCKWSLVSDEKIWTLISGNKKGQTQTSHPAIPEDDFNLWDHPFSFHFQTTVLHGWPSLYLQLFYTYSSYSSIAAYGHVRLPTTAGTHLVHCHTWRPVSMHQSVGERAYGWFTGLYPKLVQDEKFVNEVECRQDVLDVMTEGIGRVEVRVHVLTRGLKELRLKGGSMADHVETLIGPQKRLNSQVSQDVERESEVGAQSRGVQLVKRRFAQQAQNLRKDHQEKQRKQISATEQVFNEQVEQIGSSKSFVEDESSQPE